MAVRIDVERLLRDLPIERSEIPQVMARHGASVSAAAARKWEVRGRMPLDRLAILLVESRKRRKSIDILDYVSTAVSR
jgi:hypothetical protein